MTKGKTITENLVEEIYSLYPSRDINNQSRSTGKSSKDKEKIKKFLETGYPLKKAIEHYLDEIKRTKVFLKNFKTFLNNLPNKSEITDEAKPEVLKKLKIQELMERAQRAN
jgi:hypothetical protein